MLRPKGWKNPHSIEAGADPADGERYLDYEAGADAILEALRTNPVNPGYVDPRSGVFVFIPDD